jgi:hypothetical protein
MSSKKVEGRITLSRYMNARQDLPLEIRIEDYVAGIPALIVHIKRQDFLDMLFGLGCTECEIEFYPTALPKIGKVREQKELKFEIPEKLAWSKSDKNNRAKLKELAQSACDKGWYANINIDTQGFSKKIDDKWYGTGSQVRWVEPEVKV